MEVQGQGSELTPKQAKTTSYLIFGAYCMLVPVLWFVTSTMTAAGPMLAPSQYMAYGLGTASLVGSAVFAGARLRPHALVGEADVIAPGKFQTQMLIALATSEMALLLGFALLMGRPVALAPLAIGTLIVNLGVILPRLNAYWRAYEQANGPL